MCIISMWHYLKNRNLLEFLSIFCFSNYKILLTAQTPLIVTIQLPHDFHKHHHGKSGCPCPLFRRGRGLQMDYELLKNYSTRIFFSKPIFNSSEGSQYNLLIKQLKITLLETNQPVDILVVLFNYCLTLGKLLYRSDP